VRLGTLALHRPDRERLRPLPEIFGGIDAIHPAVRQNAHPDDLDTSRRPASPPAPVPLPSLLDLPCRSPSQRVQNFSLPRQATCAQIKYCE
jgi:hypothetical protein